MQTLATLYSSAKRQPFSRSSWTIVGFGSEWSINFAMSSYVCKQGLLSDAMRFPWCHPDYGNMSRERAATQG
jgi:hypothetical protein